MFEWSEEQLMVRDAVRRFIEAEVVPHIDALEHGDLPPYDIIRKLSATFGMDEIARARFKKQLERTESAAVPREPAERTGDAGAAAMALIPIIELCHYCPGIVTAMGVTITGEEPFCELFLTDVRVHKDHLLGETEDERFGSGRDSAKGNFVTERAGLAAMSLGVIEECLKLSVQYAKDRTLWGKPIGDLQLIQLKLAKMEVARLNVQNLVFRHIELSAAGKTLTLAEASAMKLYSAQAASEVALEAVQLFGGNGYMAEFRVEQLARDAKVFQIYAGTDEIQITHIAKDLLAR